MFGKGRRMVTTMVQFGTGRRVQLVFACAWCPEESWQVLDVGQEYTHGICPVHLRIVMRSMKEKKTTALSI